jgi:protein-S-isoprenylcysteine O-methyltransferase Ste14
MVPFIVKWISAVWGVFWVIWLLLAFTSKRTVQRQTSGSRTLQMVLVLIGVIFIFDFWNFFTQGWLTARLFPRTPFWALFGAALTVAGVLLCFWARAILGKNWSGTVTIKQDHELILHGPYAFVRHPIYTGLLMGMLGTAIVYGLARCLVGVFILGLGFWIKSQTEEKFMLQQFGERYMQYRRDVRALIPFIL